MSNIYIIGYRGSGKTTVSKLVGESLNRTVICLDSEIEKAHGPIKKIVSSGWDEFREIENKMLQRFSKLNNAVIDCGGGIIENKKNRDLLRNGVVFWLKLNAENIKKRLSKHSRPPLLGKSAIDEVETVLEKRTHMYSDAANYIIKADKAPEENAREIVSRINRIAISITENNVCDALKELKKVRQLADFAEIRLDFIKGLKKSDLTRFKGLSNVILTCRSGQFEGEESERLEILNSASKVSGLVDVELGTAAEGSILSFHDFEKTPGVDELNKIHKEMLKHRPRVCKIVTMANSINDNFTIFEFLKNKKNTICFCMGLQGQISRILAPRFGSFLTFASFGKESAPGQLSFHEMESYNIDLMNNETKVLGLIGKFAELSESKHIHNPLFRKHKLKFVYVPFKVDEPELAGFMDNFRKFGFGGSAVTIPYKVEIMKYLDKIDDTALKIGAVNTIVNKNGKLIGYNTDYLGAVSALEEKTTLEHKNVLVIGAGGAARAVVYGLKNKNCIVTVVNRTDSKARALARELNCGFSEFIGLEKITKEFDIIINATSVGMNSRESVLNSIPENKIVMDIVYKPRTTRFIELAKNCITITGDRMLLHQALHQFRLWTGV